jgi:hypothetical protein
MVRIGPRTNQGHQWAASHDNERVECIWCLISPLSKAAKDPCEFTEKYTEQEYPPATEANTEQEPF